MSRHKIVMGNRSQGKLERIIDLHLLELLTVYNDHSPRRIPYSYLLDVSILRDANSALLSEDMLTWHLNAARFSKVYSAKHGKRLIRRILPIAMREYSEEEIRHIRGSSPNLRAIICPIGWEDTDQSPIPAPHPSWAAV